MTPTPAAETRPRASRSLSTFLKTPASLFEGDFAFALGLLLLMLLAYGLQALRLGFYWDDWQMVYLTQAGRPEVYWRHWLYDRPFVSWIYWVTTHLVQFSPLRSQYLTILIRWLGALGCLQALRLAWPAYRWQVRWVGVLLVLYPGFAQQSVSFTYGAHFSTFTLFAGSLACMAAGLRRRRRFWLFTPLAWLLALLHVFSMEYFIGLELARLALLWPLAGRPGEDWRKTLRRAVLLWLPYLGILVLFAAWRIAIFPGITDPASLSVPTILLRMRQDPLDGLVEFIQVALRDLLHLAAGVWLAPMAPSSIELRSTAFLASGLVGLLASLLAFLLPGKNGNSAEPAAPGPANGSFTRRALPFSLLALLGGGLPVWVTGRIITEGAWSDRFALGPMLGSVLFLVCLVDWLGGAQRVRKAVLLAVLAGFCTAFQFQVADNFRTQWGLQREYYWQLGWRVPALRPGTAIIMPSLPFSYAAEYSLSFAYNAIYAPDFAGDEAPYWFVNGFRSLGGSILPGLQPNLPIEDGFRNVTFHGNTSTSLVMAYNKARGCLRVLDPAYALAPPIENEDQLLPVSNVDQILPGVEAPTPPVIFGPEPEHSWCYYYQKADLARQMQDWDAGVRLAGEVAARGLAPVNGVERLPFIEARAHTGQWDAALEQTRLAAQQTQGLEPFLCDAWQRLDRQTGDSMGKGEAIASIEAQFNCSSIRVEAVD